MNSDKPIFGFAAIRNIELLRLLLTLTENEKITRYASKKWKEYSEFIGERSKYEEKGGYVSFEDKEGNILQKDFQRIKLLINMTISISQYASKSWHGFSMVIGYNDDRRGYKKPPVSGFIAIQNMDIFKSLIEMTQEIAKTIGKRWEDYSLVIGKNTDQSLIYGFLAHENIDIINLLINFTKDIAKKTEIFPLNGYNYLIGISYRLNENERLPRQGFTFIKDKKTIKSLITLTLNIYEHINDYWPDYSQFFGFRDFPLDNVSGFVLLTKNTSKQKIIELTQNYAHRVPKAQWHLYSEIIGKENSITGEKGGFLLWEKSPNFDIILNSFDKLIDLFPDFDDLRKNIGDIDEKGNVTGLYYFNDLENLTEFFTDTEKIRMLLILPEISKTFDFMKNLQNFITENKHKILSEFTKRILNKKKVKTKDIKNILKSTKIICIMRGGEPFAKTFCEYKNKDFKDEFKDDIPKYIKLFVKSIEGKPYGKDGTEFGAPVPQIMNILSRESIKYLLFIDATLTHLEKIPMIRKIEEKTNTIACLVAQKTEEARTRFELTNEEKIEIEKLESRILIDTTWFNTRREAQLLDDTTAMGNTIKIIFKKLDKLRKKYKPEIEKLEKQSIDNPDKQKELHKLFSEIRSKKLDIINPYEKKLWLSMMNEEFQDSEGGILYQKLFENIYGKKLPEDILIRSLLQKQKPYR